MLEDKKCLIGSPCSKCIETCGYRKERKEKMEEKQVEQFPCDQCDPPHMCGYCNLIEEWKKTHPQPLSNTTSQYSWE